MGTKSSVSYECVIVMALLLALYNFNFVCVFCVVFSSSSFSVCYLLPKLHQRNKMWTRLNAGQIVVGSN